MPRLALLAFFAFAVPGWAQTDAAGCERDEDCVLSIWSDCCGGCCQVVRPWVKEKLERAQAVCALRKCASPKCDLVRCVAPQQPADFEVRCEARVCKAALKTAPAPAECRSDSDCELVYPGAPQSSPCHSSPCGCCPSVEPQAVPTDSSAAQTKPGEPTFGLSTGARHPASRRRSAERVACSPCPSQRPGRVECVEGHCALAPQALESPAR